MTGYIIKNIATHHYLERRPYDGAWTWLAASVRYATVLSHADAEALAAALTATGCQVRIDEDYLRRVPDVNAVTV